MRVTISGTTAGRYGVVSWAGDSWRVVEAGSLVLLEGEVDFCAWAGGVSSVVGERGKEVLAIGFSEVEAWLVFSARG